MSFIKFLIENKLKELKFLAEDKIKDRLAQLAREKLGSLSKEKQLQLERKKRAMAFLNQINGKQFLVVFNDYTLINWIFQYLKC